MNFLTKLFFITKAYADEINPGGAPIGSHTINNPLQASTFTELVNSILNVIIQLSIPFIVLAIVYVGYLFVTAQGRDDKLKEARKAFTWTIVGAAIVLGAFVISEVIQTTIKQF